MALGEPVMTTRDTDFSVRRLSVDELEAYRSIRLEAVSSEPAAFASTVNDWMGKSDDQWRSKLASAVFVAFDQFHRPVGMMELSQRLPSKMRHRGLLAGVYVRKSLRGSGIADKLLDAVSIHANSLGILQLELAVSAANGAAIRFYARHGFTLAGRIAGGLRDDDQTNDEIIMTWRLPHRRSHEWRPTQGA